MKRVFRNFFKRNFCIKGNLVTGLRNGVAEAFTGGAYLV